MKVLKEISWKSRGYAIVALLVVLAPCVAPAGAMVNVWRILAEPEGEIIGNQTFVVVTAYMDVYSEDKVTFSPDNTLRMWTDLADPVWYPQLSYEGKITDLPLRSTRTIVLSSWDLSYPAGGREALKVTVKGWAPGVGSDQQKTLIHIAEESPRGIVNHTEKSRVATVLFRSGVLREEIPEVPTGSLHINSAPPGARIFLEGVDKGVTPATLDRVPAGNCSFTLSLPGYHNATLSVSVLARQTVEVSTQLVESTGSSTGSLVIETTPAGAAVTLDGNEQGTTPCTIDALTPGFHTLVVSHDGYQPFEGEVKIAAGGTSSKSVHLLPAASPEMASISTSREQGVTEVSITSSPPAADVVVDGEYKGLTPVRLYSLSPGTHTVELTLPFCTNYRETFTLSPGEHREITHAFSFGEFQVPGVDAIWGFLSGLKIGLPSLSGGEEEEKSDTGPTDREKAYEELLKQVGDGEG
jgi:hypothetical protein